MIGLTLPSATADSSVWIAALASPCSSRARPRRESTTTSLGAFADSAESSDTARSAVPEDQRAEPLPPDDGDRDADFFGSQTYCM